MKKKPILLSSLALKYREHKKEKKDDGTTYLASPKTEAWVSEVVIPADFFFFSMWSSQYSTTPMQQTWQQAHKAKKNPKTQASHPKKKKASKTLNPKSSWFVQGTTPFQISSETVEESAFYQPQQTMQKRWAKTILLNQTDMFWLFVIQFRLFSKGHTEHWWILPLRWWILKSWKPSQTDMFWLFFIQFRLFSKGLTYWWALVDLPLR